MTRLRQFGLSVSSNFLTQGLSMVLAIVTLPVYIDYLGKSGYGVYSLYLVFINYLTFLDLGFNAGIIKFISEAIAKNEHEKVRLITGTVSRIYLVTSLLGASIFFFSSGWVVTSYLNNLPESLMAEAIVFFRLSALAFILNMFSIFFAGLLTGIQKQYLGTSVRRLGDSLRYLGGMSVLIAGFGLTELILINIFINLLVIGVLLYFVKREFGYIQFFSPFSSEIFKSTFSFSVFLMFGTLITVFATQANQLLIGAMLPVTALAFYSVAFDTTTKIWLIPSNLLTPAFPLWTTLREEKAAEKSLDLLIRISRFSLFLVSLLAIPLLFETDSLIREWLGESMVAETTPVFRLVLLAVFISSLFHPVLPLAYAYDLQKKVLIFQGIMALINIGLCLILIPLYGITGAGVSFLVSQAFSYPIISWFIIRKIFGRVTWFLWVKELLRFSPVILSMTISGLVIQYFSLTGWNEVIISSLLIVISGILPSYLLLSKKERDYLKKYFPFSSQTKTN